MESVCKQETHVLMREMLSPYCRAREGQKHSNLWFFRSAWTQGFPPTMLFTPITKCKSTTNVMFLWRFGKMGFWSFDLQRGRGKGLTLTDSDAVTWTTCGGFTIVLRPDSLPPGLLSTLGVPQLQSMSCPGSDTSIFFHLLKSNLGLHSLDVTFHWSLTTMQLDIFPFILKGIKGLKGS